MPSHPFPTRRLYAALGGLLLALQAAGACAQQPGRWALCPPPAERPAMPNTGGQTVLSAEQGVAETDGRSVFSGDVVILRDDRRVTAEQATYNRDSDIVELSGGIRYDAPDASFTGSRAHFDLGRNTGTVEQARYEFLGLNVRGEAERVEVLGQDETRLSQASYTTCPGADPAWLLRAERLRLDRPANTGEAWDVSLRLGDVPVLWMPYLNFPLEGRKTGLLAPSYGPSERNGLDISVPWYWNIAPHRDATLTPRLISKRGGMLMSEYRYLGEASRGELRADLLPGDQLYGADRSYLAWTHAQQLAPRWHAAVDFREVSDPDYLNDIDDTLASATTTHLERRLDLSYQGGNWWGLARVQDFQSLAAGSEPYQRRPQLLATGASPARVNRPSYDFRAEYVEFAHTDAVTTGRRIDLYPGLRLPLEGAAWFLTPRLAWHHTSYDLHANTGDDTPSRSLPVASLDGGLFFERELQVTGTPLIQTLEPRLFYLRVPFEDQSGLPVFDTAPLTFSFAQMFRAERYSGPDRVGDANQLTTALTTRFLHAQSGHELARAAIGQVQYFSDRRVTLPSEPAGTRASSDLVAELAARPLPALELSAAGRWNPDQAQTEESAVRLRYNPGPRRILDAAYRYRNAGGEMNRDLLLLWPLSPRWRALGRWYYDLVAERTLEAVVGVEYESCCWTLRAVGRDRPVVAASGAVEPNRSIYFTLELKGLANVGRDLASVIEDGLVGYQR